MQPEMKEPDNPEEATQIRAVEWQCDVLYALGSRDESYSDVVGKLLSGDLHVPENYRDFVTVDNPDDTQQIRVTKGQRWDLYQMRNEDRSSYAAVLTHLFETNKESS